MDFLKDVAIIKNIAVPLNLDISIR
jgi:hypothetical protein